ncbi:MAG: hypothetical protein ACTSW1_19005, partial [Candidatus Hodarchaeales archaeon]
VWAQMEINGNTNMGFGVLDTNVYWLKSLKIPLDILRNPLLKNQNIDLMERLIKEPERKAMDENSKIRSEIDDFFAKHLGLTSSQVCIITQIVRRNLNYRLKI